MSDRCKAKTDPTCSACEPVQGGTIIETTPGVVIDTAALRSDRPTVKVSVCRHLEGCRSCNGTGWDRAIADDGYEVMRPCALAHLGKIAGAINAAGLPGQYAMSRQGFWSGEQAEAVRRVIIWRERGPESGVWLGGRPGTGKSSLSAILAILAARAIDPRSRRQAVAWFDTPSLLSLARSDGGAERLKRARECSLLILDDIDKIRLIESGPRPIHPAYEDEMLWQLLKHRTERKAATVVTSNMPAGVWLNRTRNAAALGSRIAGEWLTVGLDGIDHRTGKGPEERRVARWQR